MAVVGRDEEGIERSFGQAQAGVGRNTVIFPSLRRACRRARPSRQPSGKFAPAGPPAGGQAAKVQEPGISPAFHLDPRSGLQPSTPPDLSAWTAETARRSPRGVGECDRSDMTFQNCGGPTRSIADNFTVPFERLLAPRASTSRSSSSSPRSRRRIVEARNGGRIRLRLSWKLHVRFWSPNVSRKKGQEDRRAGSV
jgi:hypothetical protein